MEPIVSDPIVSDPIDKPLPLEEEFSRLFSNKTLHNLTVDGHPAFFNIKDISYILIVED